MGHLFVNLAEYSKMQEKIDEPKKELCGFPAFRGDTEGWRHWESENKMVSHFSISNSKSFLKEKNQT